MMNDFHGSYRYNDVTFLMRVIDIEEISIEEKEKLIQTQKVHYSEMISPEFRPDKTYLDIFYESMDKNSPRVALDLRSLAHYFSQQERPIIVSLARAGTPIGVIIKRMLFEFYDQDVPHYSISIIKDRGIDNEALKYILKKHPHNNLAFVDGWVSKGSIAKELKSSVSKFNIKNDCNISDGLITVSDISGNSAVSVTNEDYLIPSAILNSIISGLISRSIFTTEMERKGGYHGCKFYKDLENIDLSQWYVDRIMEQSYMVKDEKIKKLNIGANISLQSKVKSIIDEYAKEHNLLNKENIKLGIGESTRALLRRVPNCVYIKSYDNPELKHIIHLCRLRNVSVILNQNLPFNVLAIL